MEKKNIMLIDSCDVFANSLHVLCKEQFSFNNLLEYYEGIKKHMDERRPWS